MTPNELLEHIRKRPAMYWGSIEYPFTSLIAFLSGYMHGYANAAKGESRIDLVPHDFHRFVTEYYGREFPDGGKGWMTFIREHSSSEEEAFALFFKLWGEYGENPGDSSSGGT